MQYTKVTFSYAFEETYLEDVFFQGLGDLGFETFDGKEAYIQTEQFSQEALNSFLFDFNAQYSTIASAVKVEDVPDQNWNAAWEAEHPMEELPDGVKIVPHCAFGAGHHETTGMLIEHIMQLRDIYQEGEDEYIKNHPDETPLLPFEEETVLDNGCGTGVLGIYAAKYGAKVTAVDIDDKSVANTLENAELNGVTIDARLGNVPPEGEYSLILSNIHRNILLEQMPLYAKYLMPGGLLFLSGFYEADVKPLVEAAKKVGLELRETDSRGEWFMLELMKSKPDQSSDKTLLNIMLPLICGLAIIFGGCFFFNHILKDNEDLRFACCVMCAVIGIIIINMPDILKKTNKRKS